MLQTKKITIYATPEPPTLHVRARGLHMYENNVQNSSNVPIQATLFDIATHLFIMVKPYRKTD